MKNLKIKVKEEGSLLPIEQRQYEYDEAFGGKEFKYFDW